MSIYTKRRCSPQGQYNIAGQRHGNVCSQAQHGDVPGRRSDGVDWPFPSKPVSHRRPLNPRTQDSLDLYDFEKIAISKQTRGPLPPQEHNSIGIRGIPGSHHLRKDSLAPHGGEMQMARAIHAKELMLQEKLWRAEEKIRQKLQRDSVGTAAGDDQKRGEESHNRGQAEREKAHRKTRLSEQHRREPVKHREDLMQEIQEDDKQLRKKQSQRDEDRMRNTHEEERGRWKKREMEFAERPQWKMKGNKGTQDIAVNKQKVSEELNKLRWQNVKEDPKMQGNEKYNCICGEAGVRPQDGIKKTKVRELNEASIGSIGLTRENKYREKAFKQMYGSDNEQDMLQMSQHKTAYRQATENHRGAEGKIFEESTLPPVSNPSYSSRPQQGELGLMDSTGASFHLLPCRICNRKFASGRLEKHVKICKKVNQSHRQVFNSYINRTKGSAIEEFWKTHSRSKTPEVRKEHFYYRLLPSLLAIFLKVCIKDTMRRLLVEFLAKRGVPDNFVYKQTQQSTITESLFRERGILCLN